MSNATISGGSCGSGGAAFTGVVDSGVSNASSESELLSTHNKRGGGEEEASYYMAIFFPFLRKIQTKTEKFCKVRRALLSKEARIPLLFFS